MQGCHGRAQRLVQGVHRSIAFGSADHAFSVGADLHGCLGAHITGGVLLDDRPPRLHLESRFTLVSAHQNQLERRVGGFEGPALGLQILDRFHDVGDPLGVAGDVVAEFLALHLHRSPTRHLGHQHPLISPDEGGVDVVVELRIHLEC